MQFFRFLTAIQIAAESLPVSSSGHVYLMSELYKFFGNQVGWHHAISKSIWLYLAHLPTICIVAWYFFARWKLFFCRFPRSFFIGFRLAFLIISADLVTTIFFVILHKMLHVNMPLWIGFLITACLLFLLKYGSTHHHKRRLLAGDAILLGACQGVALLPGVSRFATVFFAARFIGYSPRHALEITWLLQVPIMVGLLIFSIYIVPFDEVSTFFNSFDQLVLLITSTTIATFLFVLSAKLAQSNRMWVFSIYMMVPLLFSFVLWCRR